jgi:glucose/arabinose dehydrogenase
MKTLQWIVAIAAAAALTAPAGAQRSAPAASCAADNAGLTLPAGFCAVIVADSLGPIRHITVAANGDVIGAVRARRNEPGSGGVVVLRDTDGDGRLEVQRRFGPGGGSGIALQGGFLYYSTDDAVVRWPWRGDQVEPAGPPDTVASGLTNRGQHSSKGIALSGNTLYVSIGAPSNSCQVQDRVEASPGQDPCELLEISGGIWRFSADGRGQTQQQGERFATGLRNPYALAIEPSAGALFTMQHGRDDLHRIWPALYTEQQSTDLPAEELFLVQRGGDYGWPYCYFDPAQKRKLLSPEYGGDGRTVGRCASARDPELAFPAHWAPNGLAFYSGTQFPAAFRGGVFVAFHGSWNRAPVQAGYNVVFAPFRGGRAVGTWEVFAQGFAGAEVRASSDAAHRPTGLAVGPDGSLYVSDDRGGRIYRITYSQ